MAQKKKTVDRIVIRPLPDVVLLYPTAVCALIWGILTKWTNLDPARLGITFTLVFFINLSVLAFEFSRIKAVALGLFVIIVVLLELMLHFMEPILSLIGGLPLTLSHVFYFTWTVLFAVLFLIIVIDTRFNYWELTSNELLHHHGFLGDVQRWPAPSLRMTKEISDIFAFALMLSGRLVFYPREEKRAIVLDNVPRINHKERLIQKKLSTLSVQHISEETSAE